MNSFTTMSSPRKKQQTVAITCLVMAVLALFGLMVAVQTWLFLEGVILFTFVFMLWQTKRAVWKLEFEDSTLLLTDMGAKRQYRFDALTRADLSVKQTPAQKKRNWCTLRIQGFEFPVEDIYNADSLKQYLSETLR